MPESTVLVKVLGLVATGFGVSGRELTPHAPLSQVFTPNQGRMNNWSENQMATIPASVRRSLGILRFMASLV